MAGAMSASGSTSFSNNLAATAITRVASRRVSNRLYFLDCAEKGRGEGWPPQIDSDAELNTSTREFLGIWKRHIGQIVTCLFDNR